MTWIVSVAVALPPVLLAYTVYVAEEDRAVGVPEISPFEVEKVRPAGSVGVITHEVTVPPNADGVAVVIAVPFSKVREVKLYEIDGATSLTTMVTVVVALPPVLLAVTV